MRMIFFVTLAFALCASHGDAAGFEKSVMWSGKHAGYAGAAVSGVTGGQSLFFNPAGLAGPGDVSLNYSPTWINIEGNLASVGKKEESKVGPLPFAGLTASYNFGRFGFGMGAYVVGGEKAYFGGVDLTGDSVIRFKPALITDLEITEYSLGAAMEVVSGLRFGASWRINKAKGELSTIKKTVTNTAYSFLYVKDVKQTMYDGWRLGVQYESSEKNWGLGFGYRSRVTFDAPGTGFGQTIVIPTQTITPQVLSDVVRVGVIFPEAYNLGMHYVAAQNLKLLAGLDLVKYSKTDSINITGTANGTTLPNIPLNWHDMWNIRFGMEYTGMNSLALRAGYALTTQTTSSEHAKATLPPAGKGHLVVVGAGYSIGKNLDLDGAIEHSWNNGSGSMSLPTSTTKELLAGVNTESKVKVYAFHTGLTYKF